MFNFKVICPLFFCFNVGNQRVNLTLNYYFDHNLNFKSPNIECKLIFYIYFKTF